MNRIDRLIMKARKQSPEGDVFIISQETGEWMVDGRAFPDLEAARRYVEGLIQDSDQESVIIINDLEPSPIPEPEEIRKRKFKEWIAKIEAERELKETGGTEPVQPKSRNLI